MQNSITPEKQLRVIEFLLSYDRPLSRYFISKELHMPKSSTYKIIDTLVDANVVEIDDKNYVTISELYRDSEIWIILCATMKTLSSYISDKYQLTDEKDIKLHIGRIFDMLKKCS